MLKIIELANQPGSPSTRVESPVSPHEVKKWGTKGKLLPSYYFQPINGIDSGQLRMTNISVYSTTPWKEANCISKTIMNFFRSSKNEKQKLPIITDATANIGGNTVSFHLYGFPCVNAVEMDPLTCEILKHNLQVYKLPTNNVYCCDYLSIYKNLTQDVVFLDPPWGGPDYKKAKSLDLYLGKKSDSCLEGKKSDSCLEGEHPSVNIIDICVELFTNHRVTLIVLKLPTNYNLAGLMKRLPNMNFLTHKIYRHKAHSYNIIYVWDEKMLVGS